MPLADGLVHMQMFLLHADAYDTIISPECIIHSDTKFMKWAQVGHRDDTPGSLTFYGENNVVLLTLPLTKTNGLYYCTHACYMPVIDPSRVSIPRGLANRLSVNVSAMPCLHANTAEASAQPPSDEIRRTKFTRKPTMPAKQLESELWAARLVWG